MNQRRRYACTIFEGEIVVSDGYVNNTRLFNTVESYDVVGNKWSPMANMIYSTFNHSSVLVVKNKLFMIGLSTPNVKFLTAV